MSPQVESIYQIPSKKNKNKSITKKVKVKMNNLADKKKEIT